MTILFDAARLVKPRNFGQGILRSVPNYRRTWTAADEQELVEMNARRDARQARIYQGAVDVQRLANDAMGR